jgi:hypothetical protein
MGYKFSLVLSRVITDDESAILKEAGCHTAVFGTDSLPANADTSVTKLNFDDTISPMLAAAIEPALEAIKSVPDLSVPGLTVPAQPMDPIVEEAKVVAGELVEEAVDEERVEEATAKKTGTRKSRTTKKVQVSAEAG